MFLKRECREMQRIINGRIVSFELTDNTIEMGQMRYQILGPWVFEILDDLYLCLEVIYG